MTLRHQLDTLTVYDPDRSSSTVNVWVAHPSATEEQALGTLFVIGAIDGTDRVHHEILVILQEELKHQYYRSHDTSLEVVFESALQKTNHRLHQLILEGVGDWVYHAHIIVGVLWRNKLLIATLGSMHAYLIRRNRIHDILGQPAEIKPNPLRLFDQMVSGQLEEHDRLLLCTPTLLDYFSLEKLRRTLTDHSPSQATRLLETTLLGVEARVAFAGMIFQIESAAQAEVQVPVANEALPPHRITPQVSMDQLRARERSTEQLLSPSVWPAVKDFFQQLFAGIQRVVARMTKRPARRTIPRNSGTLPTPTSRPTRGASPVRQFFSTLRQAFRRPPRVTSPETLRPPSNSARMPSLSLTHWLTRAVRWYKRLSLRRRAIVLVIGLLVLILSTAVVRSGLPNIATPGQGHEAIASQVEDQLTQAEAALLFGGDDIAREHLKSATSILAQIPDRSKNDQALRAPLVDRVAALQEKLSKLTVITNPETILELAGSYPSLRPNQLYETARRFIVYDVAGQTAVVIDRSDPTDTVASTNTLDTGKLLTAAVSSKRLVFATERNNFVAFDTSTREWSPLGGGSIAGAQARAQFISIFRSRVYVLDAQDSTIQRMNLGTSNVGSSENWLEETADLTQARSAVVDGSIYVLQPDGIVEEYFGGRKTDFSLEPIDPPLTNPTRLWTSEENENLYVLEPATNRLIIFSKDGKLVAQYQSSSWNRMVDFTVDDSDTTAIILSGTNLYRLPLK